MQYENWSSPTNHQCAYGLGPISSYSSNIRIKSRQVFYRYTRNNYNISNRLTQLSISQAILSSTKLTVKADLYRFLEPFLGQGLFTASGMQ